MDRRFLLALEGKNSSRPPLWLMRQAGRYLPEYRALREKHSLKQLFFTPSLAAEVTRMPIERFGFDAAILFSDISVVAVALGLALDFAEGPLVHPKVTKENVDQLQWMPEKLEPIFEAIERARSQLAVPLIGFCGGAFTVASYLIGGLEAAIDWMERERASFDRFLAKVEEISALYLDKQVEAGVSAIQIFDSWANVLSKEAFLEVCFPSIERLMRRSKVPSIFFMRQASLHLDALSALPGGLSLGSEIPLSRAREKTAQPLQGNLDPDLLFAPPAQIQEEVGRLLESMRGDKAFLCNLGHGVKSKTPLEGVEALAQAVQRWS